MAVVTTLSHSKEVTAKVNLDNENVVDARVIVGFEFRHKFINVGAEVDISELITLGIKLGATF